MQWLLRSTGHRTEKQIQLNYCQRDSPESVVVEATLSSKVTTAGRFLMPDAFPDAVLKGICVSSWKQTRDLFACQVNALTTTPL